MTLDILTGTGYKESELSVYQLSFVRSSQERKNNRIRKYNEQLVELRRKYAKHGTLRSNVYTAEKNALQTQYTADLEQIKDDMLFKLKYLAVSDSASSDYSYPTNLDYTLAAADRYYVVYNYYMTMTDPSVRFALYQADNTAKNYLGSLYATLYDKLRSYVN